MAVVGSLWIDTMLMPSTALEKLTMSALSLGKMRMVRLILVSGFSITHYLGTSLNT